MPEIGSGAGKAQMESEMTLIAALRSYGKTVREFLLPSYRPECHYMRGPGPACAKRLQKTGDLQRLQL